jgi:hypothetical protein
LSCFLVLNDKILMLLIPYFNATKLQETVCGYKRTNARKKKRVFVRVWQVCQLAVLYPAAETGILPGIKIAFLPMPAMG